MNEILGTFLSLIGSLVIVLMGSILISKAESRVDKGFFWIITCCGTVAFISILVLFLRLII